MLHRLAESILARPLLLAALTLYWTWVNMAFQGSLFFPSVVLSSGVLFPSWIGPVGVSAVAYFALGVWFKRTNVVFRQRWYIGVIGAVMAAGALLSFLWIELCGALLSLPLGVALYALGSFGIGLGTACLLIEWGRVFGYLGPREVLFHGIMACLLYTSDFFAGSHLVIVNRTPTPRDQHADLCLAANVGDVFDF